MGEKSSGRGQWGNQIEFLLACVGYAVGLGNIWRFPYLTYENGGAAFIIPYFISLFIAGLPIFYLELCLGQFSSLGPNCIFGKLVPILQGIGWGMVTVSFLVSIYYNMIIAWVLYYFVLSFRSKMLWSSCDNWWNTAFCLSNLDDAACTEMANNATGEVYRYFNHSCITSAQFNNIHSTFFSDQIGATGPAEEFFEFYVLEKTGGIEDFGGLNYKLVLALLSAWVIIFLCLIKGVQSTGKVVYFTATFPYVVLVILLIRGLTLDGMYQGLEYYIFKPDMGKMFTAKVWREAATQIFYSVGVGFGSLLTMASYNKFHNNCFRDAVFVALTNCCTSIFAGFAIFSIMGFMAKQQNVKVSEVVQDGTGLAFIAYPEAISRMPAPYVWALLFFFMVFTLGLDSQFAMVETVTTAILDQFPSTRKHKSLVVLAACVIMFILGLPLCSGAGIFYFNIFNIYAASLSLVLIAFMEIVAAVHIYGLNNLISDIEMMLGGPNHLVGRLIGPTGWYFRITWFALAPLFMMVMFASSVAGQFQYDLKYGKGSRLYTYPGWAKTLGWLLSISALVWLPVFAIYRLIRDKQKGKMIADGFKSRDAWCPEHKRDKMEMETAKPYTIQPANAITSINIINENRNMHAKQF